MICVRISLYHTYYTLLITLYFQILKKYLCQKVLDFVGVCFNVQSSCEQCFFVQ